MKISVFGSGYVGLVAGACFADSGNDVICIDIDQNKIDRLNQGIIPIYEPGLEEMVKRNVRQKRLNFTTDASGAVKQSLFHFIAVATPLGEDGSADLQYVLAVATTIAKNMEDYKVVVDKSTVPVGTADRVRKQIQKVLDLKSRKIEFDVVSNPEFLKEGAAIQDFMQPDRVVIGVNNPRTAELMKELYTPFMHRENRLLIMDIRSAEMTKYAANALLATKISFMNEIANLCDLVDANVDHVRKGIGSDERIGPHFLYPGIGYGGSCFPKDVQALIRTGGENKLQMKILQSVEHVNETQKIILIQKIRQKFKDKLASLTFGIWGLSFKPKTDDMRAAPSIILINFLIENNVKIVVHDPAAIEEAKKIWGKKVIYKETPYEVLSDVDALLILTEWSDYRRPDFEKMKTLMNKAVIFDGRNIYNSDQLKQLEFEYFSIGRP